MESMALKQNLREIFGEKLIFNKEFDSHASRLKEGMATDLIDWCIRCKNNQELGSPPKKKEFKHLHIFFRKIASDIRVTLIKERNSGFTEIRLENHKSYDNTRLYLGYKKSSYYGS